MLSYVNFFIVSQEQLSGLYWMLFSALFFCNLYYYVIYWSCSWKNEKTFREKLQLFLVLNSWKSFVCKKKKEKKILEIFRFSAKSLSNISQDRSEGRGKKPKAFWYFLNFSFLGTYNQIWGAKPDKHKINYQISCKNLMQFTDKKSTQVSRTVRAPRKVQVKNCSCG